MIYHLGDHFQHIVNFFFRVGDVKADPKGTLGNLGSKAESQENMAWIQGAGGTGGTRGGADSLAVQKEKEAFARYAFKAEIYISWNRLSLGPFRMLYGIWKSP